MPPFVQHAGVAALTGPQDDVDAMVAEFRARRDLVVDGLNALPGVSCRSPRGAFYVFPNVADVPARAPRSWPTACSTRPAWPCWPGRRSAPQGADHLRLSYANSRGEPRRARSSAWTPSCAASSAYAHRRKTSNGGLGSPPSGYGSQTTP